MATMQVIGASPVTFISEEPATAGHQVSIPLASLKFDDKGAIDPSGWPPIQSQKLRPDDSKKHGAIHGRKLSAVDRTKLGAAESDKLHAGEGNKLGAVDIQMLRILLKNMVARGHLSTR